ncbi:hypothetical protein [uncultured Shimia sp.]|uniref:hypothetical protein n=1 Tax=uncultured Shimia sp. TaxID=573152 RepID=UPI0026173A96|nr:hypothetical protein [uncultured Shimia sp.]
MTSTNPLYSSQWHLDQIGDLETIWQDYTGQGVQVVVSHSTTQIRQMCTAGAVLEAGQLTYFDDVDEAIAVHNENMNRDNI